MGQTETLSEAVSTGGAVSSPEPAHELHETSFLK